MSDLDLEKQAIALLGEARGLQIASDAEYAASGEFLARLSDERKTRKAFFEPDIAKANALHKSLTAKLRAAIDPIERAEAEVGRMRQDYRARAAQAAQLELAKANAAATKAADDAKLSAAVELEQNGQRQEAAEVLSAPLAAVPVAAIPATPTKTDGLVVRKTWVVKSVDLSLLPRAYMMADDKKIGGVVKAMGQSHNIPGVVVEQKETEYGRKGANA